MTTSANLSRVLRDAGLTPKMLAAWAGTDRLSSLPAVVPALLVAEITPASAALALFVAGARVPRDRLRLLDAALPALVDRGWLAMHDGIAKAFVAILPLGPSLVVCDRLDAPLAADTVSWPDDSSYHLAGALPRGRNARWLDLGCGSAFAPLLRRELADAIVGVELNPRAARYAIAGGELSGLANLSVVAGDLADATGAFDLISCNAPIPGDTSPTTWRRAAPDFFDRLWRIALSCAAPGATVVVHGALPALVAAELPGERAIVDYTPDASFGVLWWRPDAPTRLAVTHRALTPERPHVDASDRP